MSLPRKMGRAIRITTTALVIGAGALSLMSTLQPVQAEQLQIDITKGVRDPLPIAIPDFGATDASAQQLARDVGGVIANDLSGSGLFRVIDKSSYVQPLPSLATQPQFADWRAIAAQALVQGEVQPQGDGRMRVSFRLWDVSSGQQMVGRALVTQGDNWRRVAHIIADEIYQKITGEGPYFDSRIVYVSETGPKNARVKRLAIMDQDGANNRILTNGDALVLTPRFSPTTQEITYLSYYNNSPRVYLFNIETGRRELLGDFPGMTFAPRFSPDGNKVILSMARDGNTEIYTMDLRTRAQTRLTNNPAIDTSPCYSPDGKQIVFNSDRSNGQQIYVMNADGSNVNRISFGDGRYATPVWSPRGDLIAFTRMKGGQFYVGVMRPDGSGERTLTDGYLVEGPSWSPNGRVLTFFRQDRGAGVRLYTIDLSGQVLRPLPTSTEASDPAWSPLLP